MRRIFIGFRTLVFIILLAAVPLTAFFVPFAAWHLGGWILLTPALVLDILALAYFIGWSEDS